VKRAYSETDSTILEKSDDLGRGGSTAVTAILINCQNLVVANIGDSRAVLSENGVAIPLSVDHEPTIESDDIKNRGGFVSTFPGIIYNVFQEYAIVYLSRIVALILPDTFYIYVSLSVAHDNIVYDSICFQYRVDI
jgi:protein phosphatase 1L